MVLHLVVTFFQRNFPSDDKNMHFYSTSAGGTKYSNIRVTIFKIVKQ